MNDPFYSAHIKEDKFIEFGKTSELGVLQQFSTQKDSDVYKLVDQWIRDNVEWLPRQTRQEGYVPVEIEGDVLADIPLPFNPGTYMALPGYRGQGLITETPAVRMLEFALDSVGERYHYTPAESPLGGAVPISHSLLLRWAVTGQLAVIRYHACQSIVIGEAKPVVDDAE